MATYGPFYPTVISGDGWTNPNNAKQPGGGVASCVLALDSTTPVITATGFGANIPADKSVKWTRVLILPSPRDTSKNIDGVSKPVDAGFYSYMDSGLCTDDADPPVALTPAVINSAEFGFDLTIYAMAGGTVEIDSIALYVDTD